MNKPLGGPLRSWDIFIDSFWRNMESGSDLQQIQKIEKAMEWKSEWDFYEKLITEQKIIVITDASLNIVFATSNIYAMNGYTQQEVISQNPRIFQGEQTDPAPRKRIQQAIASLVPFSETVKNYRKDGSLYDCYIEGFPVFNRSRRHVNFLAFENVVYG